MIKSMTGYGRGEYIDGNRRAVVEINSVNHRYFDANIRMPRLILFFEEDVRKYLKKYIARGKMDIYISYYSEAKEDISISINKTLCREYVDILRNLKNEFNLIDDISTTSIAKLPDIISIEKKADDTEQIWYIIKEALKQAVNTFTSMREKEGMLLKTDLVEKGDNLFQMLKQVEQRTPEVAKQYKQKIESRITEALENVDVDSNRILTEVAIFAERSSIDEEITRLYSHIQQLQEILHDGGVVGRKLDFLIQEMNREVNTIGSKANDKIITQYVIELKSEIEKIREQVQNIE